MYQDYTKFKKGLFLLLGIGLILLGSNFIATADESEELDETMVSETLPTDSAQNTHTDASFVEGTHYARLSSDVVNQPLVRQFIQRDPARMQVIEFFNYGCHACSSLQDEMAAWERRRPRYVAYHRVPVIFHKEWEALAKLFYTTEHLGKATAWDADIFRAIHQNHVNLADTQVLTHFSEAHGVPGEQFLKVFNSPQVAEQVRQGNNLSLAYRVSESPVVVLNTRHGSFLCSVVQAGSHRRFIELLDYLTEKYHRS